MLHFSETSKSRVKFVFKYDFWRCFNSCERILLLLQIHH